MSEDLTSQCLAFARFEIKVLKNLHVAIQRWAKEEKDALEQTNENVATADFHSEDQAMRAHEEVESDWMLWKRTERAMYGTLAVAIASTTEKFIESICQWTPLAITDAAGQPVVRPSYNDRVFAIERHFGFRQRNLPGFEDNKKARLLSNCFKHNRGRVLADYSRELGLTKGWSISYETQMWDLMIEQTMTYLAAMAHQLAGHLSCGRTAYDDLEDYDDFVGDYEAGE